MEADISELLANAEQLIEFVSVIGLVIAWALGFQAGSVR